MDAQSWDERYAESGLVWSAGPNATTIAEEVADLPPGHGAGPEVGAGP